MTYSTVTGLEYRINKADGSHQSFGVLVGDFIPQETAADIDNMLEAGFRLLRRNARQHLLQLLGK